MNQVQIRDRNQILWGSLIPQFILLVTSTIWILISPEDNVIKYFAFDLNYIPSGFAIGVILAFSGYGYYLFAKTNEKLKDTVVLFENILAPTFCKLNILDIFILSTIAGSCEEIFFRGLLQNKIGIVLASILFGLLHLPGKKYWIYALWATMSGALFGYFLLITGSLWIPIIAHATNNIIGMFLLKHVYNDPANKTN